MNTSAPLRAAPSSAPTNGTDAITPINTPPETRRSIFPADGILGQRLTYDPLFDPKLDKKNRQSRLPRYEQIIDKV
jgi:histone-lysine N-methyltransferase SETD1